MVAYSRRCSLPPYRRRSAQWRCRWRARSRCRARRGGSLIALDHAGRGVRYALLETVRAYALDLLAQDGDRISLARRHAVYFLNLFDLAQTKWRDKAYAMWLRTYRAEIGNVRAALE
jgi:predicted ATPase